MASLISEVSISRIYLMLGPLCNFKCRHCVQECHLKSSDTIIKPFATHMSDDTKNYIWHLINIRDEERPKLNIMFWGGEPLLYINTIKDIIAIYGNSVTYTLVTNGSLLTPDLITYLNEHNITVVLSNDGENTGSVRDTNLLDSPNFCDLFSTVNNKAVDSVIHGHNYNYQDLVSYINNKLGPDIKVYTEQLNVTWNMPEDLYRIDYDSYANSLVELANNAYDDIISGNISFAARVFLPALNIIAYGRRSPSRLIPNCMQMFSSVNLDLDGNVYACHNSTVKLGTVKDDRMQLILNYEAWVKSTVPDACSSCELFYLCRSGCPLEKVDDTGVKISCLRWKIFYMIAIQLAAKLNSYYEPVSFEV